MRRLQRLFLVFWIVLPWPASAAETAVRLQELPLPLPDVYASPALTATPHGPMLSWLEGPDPRSQALRYAVLDASGWSEPETVVRDRPFWLSWADPPWLTVLDDGTRVAHWPERAGDDPYDYVTRMALKPPDADWGESFLLHDDVTPVQHGLPAAIRGVDGTRHYLWLDARDEDMALYTRTLDGSGRLGPERRLDAMTCSCCRIALATLPDGELLTAYRDRTAEEVRDIRMQRYTDSTGWSESAWRSDDGWVITGCPVNGPALAVSGQRVALAWFTAADDRNRVHLVRSDDAGRRFASAGRIDAGDPVGRPSLLFDAAGHLLATWLETTSEGIRVHLAIDPGTPGAMTRDLLPAPGRFSGYPQLLAHRGEPLLFLAAETSARLFRLEFQR